MWILGMKGLRIKTSKLLRDKRCCQLHLSSLRAVLYTGTLTLLSPSSDQERISPHTINTISSRQVMRIKKNTN